MYAFKLPYIVTEIGMASHFFHFHRTDLCILVSHSGLNFLIFYIDNILIIFVYSCLALIDILLIKYVPFEEHNFLNLVILGYTFMSHALML